MANRLGIIIGTSFRFSESIRNRPVQSVSTPFGTADIAHLDGAVVAFRHGKDGDIPAHRIRHAANLAALDHLDPSRPAREFRYTFLDLETTGLDPEEDRVVSVGAVRMVGGRVRLSPVFSELVNPGRGIPVESIRIHGITPAQVAGARPAWEVFEDFLAWLGGDILVAHYARFELSFINRTMCRLYGFPLQNLVLDTVTMAERVVLPSDPYGIGRHKSERTLDNLARRFSIGRAARHTALGDALLTAQVFQQMLALLQKRRPGTLADLIRAARLE